MKQAALLLVDLQQDYLRAPALLPSAGSIVAGAAATLAVCRDIGIPVAHCRTAIRRDMDERMPHWKRADRWHCEVGSDGYAPPSPLIELEGEKIFHKTFYSPFADPKLQDWLMSNGTTTVLLAGVHLHACVRAAALDAYERGFQVVVIDDAVGSDDPLHAAATRRYLRSRVARFISHADLRAMLDAAEDPPPLTGSIANTSSASRDAAASWRGTSMDTRAERLTRMCDAVGSGAEKLARTMTSELGKPISAARAEVASLSRSLKSVLNHARDSYEAGAGSRVRLQPRGVVAIITPWNNPVAIPLGKILPALAYGNSVIWKPSPQARDTSQLLFSFLEAAGCPVGLLAMVEGGTETGELLMAEADVDAVAITGSERTGRAAQDLCGRRMLPLQAELGGNNAAIVWDDCDLEQAATEIARGAFGFAGQRCTANRRVIVSSRVRAQFLNLLIRATSELPWGDPQDPQTVIGPVVSHQSRERLESLIERTMVEDVTLHRPHTHTQPGDEPFFAPVIVEAENAGSEIVQEESFGPIAVLQTASTWDAALDLCNGVRQGLVAALFSTSPDRHREFIERAQAGILKINGTTADADIELPFGGWKHSGIGPPEHGASDREFYTRTQAVYGEPTER